MNQIKVRRCVRKCPHGLPWVGCISKSKTHAVRALRMARHIAVAAATLIFWCKSRIRLVSRKMSCNILPYVFQFIF